MKHLTKDDKVPATPLVQLLQRIDAGQEFHDAHCAVIAANNFSVKEGEQLMADYDNYCARS